MKDILIELVVKKSYSRAFKTNNTNLIHVNKGDYIELTDNGLEEWEVIDRKWITEINVYNNPQTTLRLYIRKL